MAECQLPKLNTRVRFPSRAPRRGDEIDVTPIFFSIHAGFRAFQGRFFKIAPPWMSNPQKSKNSKKPPSCYCSGRRFFHFLDTGREMIFDCPSGLSWNLTGEGGAGGRPAAGTEETIKQPSFSSIETDIFPFSQFKRWRSSAGRTILPNPSIARKYRTAITSRRLNFQFPSGLFQRFLDRL